MDLAAEHPTLVGLASSLIERLRGLPTDLAAAPGGAVWLHHTEFAARSERLGEHLEAILHLLGLGRHPSALVVTRTALEHHLLDRLLLLATRYVEIVRPDDPTHIDTWEQDLATRAEPWTESVVSAERTKDLRALRLVREGHDVKDDQGTVREHVSPYWAAMKRFDAFVGHPDLQQALTRPFDRPEDRIAWAKRNQRTYGGFMRWESICSNLELNELVTAPEAVQLRVHYTFLSAFAHASNSGYGILSRQARGDVPPGHLMAELGLLYVTTIARRAIESWDDYLARRANLLAPLPASSRSLCEAARTATSYFWFLGGDPQPIDFCDEANRRAEPFLLRGERPDRTPSEITADELSYYPNPYERLARMHVGEREMTTGFGFGPAWPTLVW